MDLQMNKNTASDKTGEIKPLPGLIQFDLDGTLLNTYEVILSSMRHTVNKVYGHNLSDEALMAEVGIPLATQMQHYCPEDPQGAFEEYIRYQACLPQELVQPYPGILECLTQLKVEGYKLAVVTSKLRKSALDNLYATDMIGFFDEIVGADDVERAKPDPFPVIHTAQLLNTPLQRVVYVGDSPFDMQAANGAGVFSIAVTWGVFGRSMLERENPNFIAEKSEELIEYIHEALI